jgi:hypothetical protein
MIDLRERTRQVERIAPPDLWPEIARRVTSEADVTVLDDPSPPWRSRRTLRRAVTIAAAFALAAAAVGLAIRAFDRVERRAPAVPTDVEWIRPGATQGHDGRSPIATDASGVYVLTDTTDRSAGYDVRLTRYDDAGNAMWSTVFGTPAIDDGDAIAVSSNAVYVVTGTHGRGHFLLVRFDKGGDERWREAIEHPGRWADVSFAANDVYVLVGGADHGDAMLVKFATDGAELWRRDVSGFGGSVSADSTGEYVTSWRPDPERRGAGDATLQKFDPDGNQVWAVTGDAGDRFVDGVATGDGVYVTGSSESKTDGGRISSSFVRRYGVDGAQAWTRVVPGSGFGINTGGGIAADATNVYVATLSSGRTVNGSWQAQPVVRAWDATGVAQWAIAGNVDPDVGEASIDVAVWGGAVYVSWEEGGHVLAGNLFPTVARWKGFVERLETPGSMP